MPALPIRRIATLLEPYSSEEVSETALKQLSTYLDLLLRWNAKTNLTAIRDPEQIVQRHFGESIFASQYVPASATSLLDLGSGAGFPGLPIQLLCPDLQVTLAESQNKKVAFLREVIRTLALPTTVWAARVEGLPSAMKYDVVTLRAVDNPIEALRLAENRVATGGSSLHLTVRGQTVDEFTTEYPIPCGSKVVRVRKIN